MERERNGHSPLSPDTEFFENFRSLERDNLTDKNTPNRPIEAVYVRKSLDMSRCQETSSVLDDAALSADVRATRSRIRCDRELSRLRSRALRDDAALLAYADALATLAKAGAR